jgi:hypothetical protein
MDTITIGNSKATKKITVDKRFETLERIVTKLWNESISIPPYNRLLKSIRTSIDLLEQGKKEAALAELRSGCAELKDVKFETPALLYIMSFTDEEMEERDAPLKNYFKNGDTQP